MKKLGVMVTALVLCVALGVTSLAIAKPQTKKVTSTITLTFTQGSLPYSPYTPDRFFGDVKAKKGCKKDRTVVIDGTSLTTTTDSSGDYSIDAGNVAAGTYTATVTKKKRKKDNGTKIICKPDTSDPVTVP
jgi:hypothetical protein